MVDEPEPAGQLAEPERVGEPDPHRADRVAPADVGAHRVADVAHSLRLDPVEHEPRPRAEYVGERVFDEKHAGRQAGEVLETQDDLGLPARLDPGGLEHALRRNSVTRPHDDDRGDERQCHDEDADPEQVAFPEHDPGNELSHHEVQQGPKGGHPESEPEDQNPQRGCDK